MKCLNCGNENASMMFFMKLSGEEGREVCDECDPFMQVPIRPDFICPYNDVYCMFDYREGHRGGCSCWGCDLKDWRSDTKFCWPNRTLIESLKRGSEKDRNRLISILMSEKLRRKFFINRETGYELQIVRIQA